MSNTQAQLHIKDLELHVHLGWHNEERENLQKILLDILIDFETAPKACDTDNLEDTFCYAEMINMLANHVAKKKYLLVEHLGKDIHQTLIANLPLAKQIKIDLTKFPAIKGLMGGVKFSYC